MFRICHFLSLSQFNPPISLLLFLKTAVCVSVRVSNKISPQRARTSLSRASALALVELSIYLVALLVGSPVEPVDKRQSPLGCGACGRSSASVALLPTDRRILSRARALLLLLLINLKTSGFMLTSLDAKPGIKLVKIFKLK